MALGGTRTAGHRTDFDSISATSIQRAPWINGARKEHENGGINLVERPLSKGEQPIVRPKFVVLASAIALTHIGREADNPTQPAALHPNVERETPIYRQKP